jgi:hypothetical protein
MELPTLPREQEEPGLGHLGEMLTRLLWRGPRGIGAFTRRGVPSPAVGARPSSKATSIFGALRIANEGGHFSIGRCR